MARRGENIYKRKDGRYEGRYIKSYDMSGKAVYGYIYSKSYTQLKEKLANCKIRSISEQRGSDMLLRDWLASWIQSTGLLKPTTKRIYKSHIENHINPKIGKIPLKKLNNEILQSFINNLDLSPSTVKTLFYTLKSALSDALDKGYINNIWSKVKLPKKENSIVRVLSVAEQHKLEKILTSPADTGILICLYTGIRIGELCALKWSDINSELSILTVNGTQARTENGVEIISPKSRTSKREIPIPPFLLDKILAIPRQGEFVISKGKKYFDTRTYRRHFKILLKKAGLPDMKFHSLRHTFATRALEIGMDYKTLSEILGHSSVAITLDLYAHSLNEHKKKQMCKLFEIYNS